MPEPHSHPNPDERLRPADGLTPSTADPNATQENDPASLPFADTLLPSQSHLLPSLRYQLLAEIARGGMGVVWRAIDTALGREVAVKVLQDKYASDSGAARRFAEEARITAQLQHPAIPPVHDLGALADGRPLLAMKLIKGQTLDQLLAARSAPSAQRGRFVAVFEQVCQAVAYAHAHGVLHRDLKPSNVMVGAFGEVQLMDWGLAKLVASRERPGTDADETRPATQVVTRRDSDQMFTRAGSILGTPSYMPPEQAIGAIDQIDSRSDVFGLGGILAAVLTGRPPFVGDTSESTRLLAARGKVQDCFARLDACGADPELIALCKHCLAPEKEDRPANGGAVAQAVAQLRAAADERARRAELDKIRVEGEKTAAEARVLERRKRRRLWLGAAAALMVAAVGGLAAVLAVQRQANAVLAAKNNELADEQAKVQARFELARKAIAIFHTGVSEDVLLKNPQFKEMRTKLLREAVGFYGDLEKLLEGQTDAPSRRLLAEGYFRLGELTEKIGSRPEALAVHRQALAVRRELAAATDADVETRLDVARSLEAVAALLAATGNSVAALAAYEEVRELAAQLEAESPTHTVQAMRGLSQNGIGLVLSDTGKPAEALKAYEQGRDILQKLAAANPAVTDYQRDLARSHNNISQLLWQTGKSAEALQACEQGRDILQKLEAANPTVTEFQSLLAGSHNNIGYLLGQTGKLALALKAFEQARDIRQKLTEAHPAVSEFQSDLASSYNNLGWLLPQLGKPAEAVQALEKARDIRQKLADDNPTVTEFQNELAACHVNIGIPLASTGRSAAALHAYEKAREILQRLVDANPTATEYRLNLASCHNNRGELLARLGRAREALAVHRQARDLFQQLADASPTQTNIQINLAISNNNLGRVHTRLDQLPQALAALDAGRTLLGKLTDADPTDTGYSTRLGSNHAIRGWAALRAGQPAKAADHLRQALEVWAKNQTPDVEERYDRAWARALLAALGADPKSGVSAAEAAAFADQAMAGLQDAAQAGWGQWGELKEADFDALRKRADFQKLVKELEAKAAAADRGSPDPVPPPKKK